MKVIDILNQSSTLSFEVFPPKKADSFQTVGKAAQEIAKIGPDFMSITYGAGGGTSAYTLQMAKDIKERDGVEVLAHLTCVSSSRETVEQRIRDYKENGIENIMALRGDIPADGRIEHDYEHAFQLIHDLKKQGDFCIGGACYPEGHIETEHRADDIAYLKQKVDAGCDFLTTQMFFDNNIYYNFLYRIREAGINVPVIAGIMPVTTKQSLGRSVKLSGTQVPRRFIEIVDHFGDDPEAMKQAGILYASEQIVDLLANNVRHIHVYTMNKPDVAKGIYDNVHRLMK